MMTAAIFKYGSCECWISPIIIYVKVEYPEIYNIKYKSNGLCKTVPEIRKSNFFNIAKHGGSIKMSGYSHQNSEIIRNRGYLCQISCFCPAL